MNGVLDIDPPPVPPTCSPSTRMRRTPQTYVAEYVVVRCRPGRKRCLLNEPQRSAPGDKHEIACHINFWHSRSAKARHVHDYRRKETAHFDHRASGCLQHVGSGAVAAHEDHPLVGRRDSRRRYVHASHLPHPDTGCTPGAQTLPAAVRLPRACPHGSRNGETMRLIALLTHAETVRAGRRQKCG